MPMVLDCDPGIDDAVALLILAGDPGADLRAVTAVGGNVGIEHTTRNALDLLALAGRADVPVAAGAARPLTRGNGFAAHVHGENGMGGVTLPTSSTGPYGGHAVELLAAVVRESPEPVTLIATGPLTNVALFYAVHPSLAARLDRVVVMGGGMEHGNRTPAAEFNIWWDPEAAYRVLTEPGIDVPTTVVPLDVTLRCGLSHEQLAVLAAQGGVGAGLAGALDHYRDHYLRTYGIDRVPIHDAVAVLEALAPGIVRTQEMNVEVDTSYGPSRGATLADRHGVLGRPASVRMGVDADGKAVAAEILARLAARS